MLLRGLSTSHSTYNIGGGDGVFNMEEQNHSQSWQLFSSRIPEKYDFWPLAGISTGYLPNHRYNSTSWPRIYPWQSRSLGAAPQTVSRQTVPLLENTFTVSNSLCSSGKQVRQRLHKTPNGEALPSTGYRITSKNKKKPSCSN